MPWKFPIFLSRRTLPDSWCKFTPKNDFSVSSPTHLCPIVISEIVSQNSEQDKCRMLVEAIVAARAGQYLLKAQSDKQFFIVAIYLRESLIAERYIVAQTRHDRGVSIAQRDFDLNTEHDAIDFLREMYNLATELKDLGNDLDENKKESLQKLQKAASKLPSLTSEARRKTTTRSTMASVAEERDEPGFQDDLGVFAADDIQTILKEMNYKIEYIAFGHPRIAVVSDKTDDSCTVISMPVAGGWLTSLKNPDSNLWSVAQQLFEAVDFMHKHGVAHLDLKPQNIIIPSDGGRLSVIDFNTSVRVKGPGHMFHGVVGTDGYIPPEVEAGVGQYSPLRADLWSCGKTMEELCSLCRPSEDRDVLLEISRRLMNQAPTARPMMTEVLEWISRRKVDASPVPGLPSPPPTPPPTVHARV
ncbi:kinase-like domain-containing protein [Hygrophoropsis aurantiaca]|uniref:Kinase-like domain-containing protein n=1 Tax=Hygrophoropsis aurantiaca TaxID=72124 RepID=A0ACB7ZVD8_9AGAM|nr:kinase-like domain-containing protein [Hygrophoropsis aurantiaca]